METAGQELIIYVDTECSLCSGLAKWIARNDPETRFRIRSIDSPEALSLLQKLHAGAPARGTIVFDEAGRIHLKSTAVLRVLARLRFPWSLARHLLVIPEAFRDAVYSFVSRNRYRLFQQRRFCKRDR